MNRVLDSDAPAQGTGEWLLWRRTRLTASDAPILCGRAVATRAALLRSKLGYPAPDVSSLDFVKAGHANEIPGIRRYEAEVGLSVRLGLRPVCHPDHPRLAASLDGLREDGVVVEMKSTASLRALAGPKPVHVRQVYFQLECSGLQSADLVYFHYAAPEPYLQVFRLERDREWFASHLPEFLRFLEDLDGAERVEVSLTEEEILRIFVL